MAQPESYTLSAELVDELKEVLRERFFVYDSEFDEESNDDGVIGVYDKLITETEV